jgi:hypothetical protein
MTKPIIENFRNMFKLFNFVFWYALAVSAVFYFLPRAAVYLQGQYETLSGSTRLLLLGGLVVSVCIAMYRLIRSRHLHKTQPAFVTEVTFGQQQLRSDQYSHDGSLTGNIIGMKARHPG